MFSPLFTCKEEQVYKKIFIYNEISHEENITDIKHMSIFYFENSSSGQD